MKHSILHLAAGAATASLLLAGCSSKMKNFTADQFVTNPNPLEVVANSVPAVITGSVPADFFKKDALVTITPVLAYDGTEMEYTPVQYMGEDVRANAPVINSKRGGLMTIPVNFIYNPAMHRSELYLAFTVQQGNKSYALPRVKVADGILATATLSNALDVAPALTPDKFQRIINEKYSNDIRFLINRANLRESELQSQGMLDLSEALRDAAGDAFKEITEINIQSYASPEGSYELNTRLAEERERNTRSYLEGKLKKDNITEFGELTAQFTPEDWEGFQKLVAASNIQDKDLILSVLSMYKDPTQREQEIRNLASIFDQLAEEILPQLRYSRITASVDIIGKSDPEIYRAVLNDPYSLTADELLYAATLDNDPEWKKRVYNLAVKVYPNDYRSWNNLGLVQYAAGDVNAAAESFAQAARLSPSTPEVNMNQGLIALAKHNYRDANTAFGQAAGVSELGDALGVYYLEQGNYPAAVRSFGASKTNNAALAQILAKDYASAAATLNAIKTPDATTYYLKAVNAARQGNTAAVLSNLAQVKNLSPELYAHAKEDLEFANYIVL